MQVTIRPHHNVYRFHRCSHNKTEAWYIEVRDLGTAVSIHNSLKTALSLQYDEDPHGDQYGAQYDSSSLLDGWLEDVRERLEDGGVLLVNIHGGYIPLESAYILESHLADDIDWHARYDDELITVSRWPGGSHYYLSSSRRRIFVPDKHDSLSEAIKEALRFVPQERIKESVEKFAWAW